MNETDISMETVRMFRRIMRPVAETGVIPLTEFNVGGLVSAQYAPTLTPFRRKAVIDAQSLGAHPAEQSGLQEV